MTVSWIAGEIEAVLAPSAVATVRTDMWQQANRDIESRLRALELIPPGYPDLTPVVGTSNVISVSSDVLTRAWRHRSTGYVFAPLQSWLPQWSEPARAFLVAEFDDAGVLAIDTITANLTRLVESRPRVILVNMFRAVSEPRPVHFVGTGETLRERIRKANVMIARVSRATGARVVDVDSVLGHVGAVGLATDYRLTSERARTLVAEAIAGALEATA
jgi:hypothetical protein